MNETDWEKKWDGEVILSNLNRMSGGVALIFSKNFLPQAWKRKMGKAGSSIL